VTRVAILGSGTVGQTLARGFQKYGNEVIIGTQNPAKKIDWQETTARPPDVTTYQRAAEFADIFVLAVKGTVAEDVAKVVGPHAAGKIVIDATNPIAELPPENGVLRFFTTLDESLMERLQKLVPQAHFVKAFNSVGNALMVNPDFGGIQPTMFICGNDEAAKREVSVILDRFGWDSEDMGSIQAARAIEPLCMLWCIPGFTKNQWSHAFKLLKQ
jgi:8-hydroxy-5-deazaflavin:NADPH oxidoreductase